VSARTRTCGASRTALVALVLSCAAGAATSALAQTAEVIDPAGDAVSRRTDMGADGPLYPNTTLPDVLSVRVMGEGGIPPRYDVLRITVVLGGHVNPPGIVGTAAYTSAPFQFGLSPVFGTFEFDIDNNINTGGEFGGPERTRYTAHVARFGEVPTGVLSARVARQGSHIDTVFATTPQIERSGADFAFTLCGCFPLTVVTRVGDLSPQTFDPGDDWTVSGRFVQRAGGFEDASAMSGGTFFGHYDPISRARFVSSLATNTTTIDVRFPLTMAGAAMMAGQPQQYEDLSASNHVSVVEGLADIIEGAPYVTNDPGRTLVQGWAGRDARNFIDPSTWRITGLVGTTYAALDPLGASFVWTDAVGAHVFADFDASGVANKTDLKWLVSELSRLDGSASDADGVRNGAVRLANPGPNFNVLDLTGDGVIDADDLAAFPSTPPPTPTCPGDADRNGVVAFGDITTVLAHFGEVVPPGGEGDANNDGAVTFNDITTVLANFGVSCQGRRMSGVR
jgi:hypothetical protein